MIALYMAIKQIISSSSVESGVKLGSPTQKSVLRNSLNKNQEWKMNSKKGKKVLRLIACESLAGVSLLSRSADWMRRFTSVITRNKTHPHQTLDHQVVTNCSPQTFREEYFTWKIGVYDRRKQLYKSISQMQGRNYYIQLFKVGVIKYQLPLIGASQRVHQHVNLCNKLGVADSYS